MNTETKLPFRSFACVREPEAARFVPNAHLEIAITTHGRCTLATQASGTHLGIKPRAGAFLIMNQGDNENARAPQGERKDGGKGLPASDTGKPDIAKEKDGMETNREGKDPRWTSSLKQVYDPILDEPIPDSIMDLLSKLDTDEGK